MILSQSGLYITIDCGISIFQMDYEGYQLHVGLYFSLNVLSTSDDIYVVSQKTT